MHANTNITFFAITKIGNTNVFTPNFELIMTDTTAETVTASAALQFDNYVGAGLLFIIFYDNIISFYLKFIYNDT